MTDGYWWCAECHQEVDCHRVTNQEMHDTCGNPVVLVEPKDPIALLRTQLAALQSENGELRAALSRVEAERDAVKRTLDGICSQIDNDCWLRKQFCENGDSDLEPCLCPSLREHSGYIDSDDCEGCDFFVNSWRGAQGEA